MTDVAAEQRSLGSLQLGERRVDLDDLALWQNGRRTRLTRLEARVLDFLGRNAGRNVDKRELLRHVWGYAPRAETRAIEATIHRLRIKIEDDPRVPRFLHTCYGVGYRLEVGAPHEPLVGGLAFARAVAGRLAAPFVLLGLPGGGKTRMAHEISLLVRGARVRWVEASAHPGPLLRAALLEATNGESGLLVVDGLADTATSWRALDQWRELRGGWRLVVTTDALRPPAGYVGAVVPALSAAEAVALAKLAAPAWAARTEAEVELDVAAAGGNPAAILAIARSNGLDDVRARFARAWAQLDAPARRLMTAAVEGGCGARPLDAAEVEALCRLQQTGWLRAAPFATPAHLVAAHPLVAALAEGSDD